MNPFDGLAHFFLGLLQQNKIQAWIKLIFSLLGSGILSFLYACGLTLGTSATAKLAPSLCWLAGISAGMIAAAISMTVVWRRSPLTKGLMLVLPAGEAKQEINTDVQIISK